MSDFFDFEICLSSSLNSFSRSGGPLDSIEILSPTLIWPLNSHSSSLTNALVPEAFVIFKLHESVSFVIETIESF